jgi:GNAT superfamily N-acetyltransferase
MSASQRISIPFPGRSVAAFRCTERDTLVLADWCDMHLGRDFFFRRRHVESIIKRPTNAVYALLIDDFMAGLLMLYKGSVLHNFYLAEEFRGGGIGSAILQFFLPDRIRSKTNMAAGDPTPFYEHNGYVVETPDPLRPHIKDMVLPPLTPAARPEEGASSTAQATVLGQAIAQPATTVGQQAARLFEFGEDLAEQERLELEALRKKEKNRERARLYREKKKATTVARAAPGDGPVAPTAGWVEHFDPLAERDSQPD